MTKAERTKMRKRARRMAVQHAGLWIHENTIVKFVAREVDRAVRAERNAQIERAKGIGRK